MVRGLAGRRSLVERGGAPDLGEAELEASDPASGGGGGTCALSCCRVHALQRWILLNSRGYYCGIDALSWFAWGPGFAVSPVVLMRR